MVVPISKLLLRLVVATVVVGTIGGLALAGLLVGGPVSLPWLTPYVERALESGYAGQEVTIDDVRLRLGQDQLLELSALGVRAVDPMGAPRLELADMQVSLSTSALLLHGIVAPQQLAATVPRLELIRRQDGSIGLGDRRPAGSPDEELDLGLLIEDFLEPPEPRTPLAFLERILVTSEELVFVDRAVGRTLKARDARAEIELGGGEARAQLDFELDQAQRRAPIRVRAEHDVANRRIAFDLDFESLTPAIVSPYVPTAPLDGIDLEIDGAITGAITTRGDLAPIGFRLAASGGTVELPETLIAPLPIDRFGVRGSLDDDLRAISIEALSVETLGVTASGHGGATWRDGAPTLHGDLVARNVAAEDLRLLWPPGIKPGTRKWVTENITEGVVPEAHVALRFGPGDLAQDPVPEDTVSGAFGLRDLTIGYYRTMPPLTDVSGTATFTARRMDFVVTGGHVGDLQLGDQGSVAITGMGIPGRDATRLGIEAEISGPLDQALRLIDYPPLGFAAKVGIVPEMASGAAVTELRIDMPLVKDLEIEEVRVEADATIAEATLRGEPIDLDNGNFVLAVDDQGLDLAGGAVVVAVPVELEIRENFADDAPFKRRYRVRGTPEVAALDRLGVELPFDASGRFALDATVTERAAEREVELDLDLAALGVDLPALHWDKPSGEPGTLRVSAVLPDEGSLEITAFSLESTDLGAAGSLEAQMGPFRLMRARLDRLRLRDSEASITLWAFEPEGYEAEINAETLNLSPWGGGGANDNGLELPPLRLQVRAERLIVDDDYLTDVDANAVLSPSGWRSARLVGGLPSGGQIEASLSPAEDRRQLNVTSTDAGDLLRSLDQTSRIVGGELALTATIFRQRPSLDVEGVLRASDFDILDAPTLARLLTLASLTGITDVLAGEGLHVDELEVPFTLDGDLVTIAKGRMYGSQLGLTFEGEVDRAEDVLAIQGTVVPVYGVNWALGQIPVIGALLKGSEGEGAFAANYSLTGSIDDPKIAVNPLSALTPGFLKELFRGLRAGDLKPPEAQPSGGDD